MSAESTVNVLKQRLQKVLNKQEEEEWTEDSVVESCKDCLERLNQVEMNLSVLTNTLIGATVSKYKAHPALGTLAKDLIAKWKKIAKTQEDTSAAAAAGSSSNKNDNDSHSKAAKKATKKKKQETTAPPAARRNSATTLAEVASEEVQDKWTDLPPHRQNICQKCFEYMLVAKPALVQAGMNATAIDGCVANTAIDVEAAIYNAFPNDKKAYTDKARSIAVNLKKNTQLSQDLVFGAIPPDELPHMTAEQLASDAQRKQREEEAKRLIDSVRLDWDQANEDKINQMCGIKGDLLKASLFTCGRCKSPKTTSTQKQTRSADEPMTVFVLCLNCGNRWKFS